MNENWERVNKVLLVLQGLGCKLTNIEASAPAATIAWNPQGARIDQEPAFVYALRFQLDALPAVEYRLTVERLYLERVEGAFLSSANGEAEEAFLKQVVERLE